MDNTVNWDEFTFRCSSLGHIMTNPKGKSNMEKYLDASCVFEDKMQKFMNCDPDNQKLYETLADQMAKAKELVSVLKPIKDIPHLSQTCKNHLADIYTRVVYGRHEDIESKYIEKGLLLEEDAITNYALLTGNMFKKNKQRRKNEFIEGEIDFEDKDYVVDTKVNWSIFQYNRVVGQKFKPLYKWQLKGYCWLWDKPKARLAYCLLNTPEHLIQREERRLQYNWIGSGEDLEEAYAKLRHNHIYDDIPLEEKVRVFEADIKKSDKDVIAARVIDCRKYLMNFNKFKTLEEFYETE